MVSFSDIQYIQNGDANVEKVTCYYPTFKTRVTSSNAQVNTKHFKAHVFLLTQDLPSKNFFFLKSSLVFFQVR